MEAKLNALQVISSRTRNSEESLCRCIFTPYLRVTYIYIYIYVYIWLDGDSDLELGCRTTTMRCFRAPVLHLTVMP